MKTKTITIRGMHCASCEKSIRRAFAKSGIRTAGISHMDGKATISYSGEKNLREILSPSGYAVDEKTHPTAAEKPERRILLYGLTALVLLSILQAALLTTLYDRLPGYSPRYLLPLLALPAAVIINLVALWHQRAYRRDVSCMTGMMIGMTIGMTTGMTIGYIAGLLNGMFYGAVIGLAVAMAAGAYAGRCCGIMGLMEGMMAGLMGGTMGAMLAVMLIADHPIAFLFLLILLSAIILGGLMRVVYNEHKESMQEVRAWPAWTVLAVGLASTVLLSALMMLLPKGLY